MKPITSEWISKADGDFATAQREFAVGLSPNYDAVCFHAHQCAEKYLKARIIEASVSFPKTHDLTALLNLLLVFEPDWESLRSQLNLLTEIGIEVRYPGMTADAEDAGRALEAAQNVRLLVRQSMNLDS